jgi:predicted  nucleic acid-binding Zn-ribbon protein
MMNEDKLDLILTVVSELKGDVKKIDTRMENLEKEFKDFKKKVIEAIKQLDSRINTLEKQMFSIGVELKEEIRREVRDVRDEINRLENTIMLEQAEKLQDRVKVREIESRLSKLEEKFRLAA